MKYVFIWSMCKIFFPQKYSQMNCYKNTKHLLLNKENIKIGEKIFINTVFCLGNIYILLLFLQRCTWLSSALRNIYFVKYRRGEEHSTMKTIPTFCACKDLHELLREMMNQFTVSRGTKYTLILTQGLVSLRMGWVLTHVSWVCVLAQIMTRELISLCICAMICILKSLAYTKRFFSCVMNEPFAHPFGMWMIWTHFHFSILYRSG